MFKIKRKQITYRRLTSIIFDLKKQAMSAIARKGFQSKSF